MIFGFKDDKSKVDILNMFYPIGCYFHTSNESFNPNTEWGGDWTLVEEGQVLLAGSTNGTYEVGNSYGNNTHTLTVNEIPPHKHRISYRTKIVPTGTAGTYYLDPGTAGTWIDSPSIESTGGGAAHSIMQASTAVYIWHRTA